VLVEPGGDVTDLRRQGAPIEGLLGSRPVRAPEVDGIVGAWLVRLEQVEIRVTFSSNGRFWEVVRGAGGIGESRGRYTLAGDVLTAHPEDGGAPIVLRVRRVDRDTIELQDPHGRGYRFARQR
jgi:hypothetical protein